MAAPIVSRAEDLLVDALKRRGLRVSRQVSVPTPQGDRPFLLDLAVMDARVDIEVDGPHHDTPSQRAKDEYRDRWLRRHGWHVIRVPADAVHQDADAVAAKLARMLDRAGHTSAFAWPLMMVRRALGNRVALLVIVGLIEWVAWALLVRDAHAWRALVLLLCAIAVALALRVTRLDYLPMGAGGFVRRRRKPFTMLSDAAFLLVCVAFLFGVLAWMS